MDRIDVAGISVETYLAGEGRPVLFLHGGDYFAQNIPFLDRLATRYRVIAPRHPGFGNTSRPGWFRTVHDIATLYQQLIETLDLNDVTIVGSSFGGWVALEMAIRPNARVARMVLLDTLGLKFGGPCEREIADVYALPLADVLARTFVDAGAAPDYTKLEESELLGIAHDREAAVLYGWEAFTSSRLSLPMLPMI